MLDNGLQMEVSWLANFQWTSWGDVFAPIFGVEHFDEFIDALELDADRVAKGVQLFGGVNAKIERSEFAMANQFDPIT